MPSFARVSVLRDVTQITVAFFFLLAISSASTPAEDDGTEAQSPGDVLFKWCLSRFPGMDEEAGTISRPRGKPAPLKVEEMIAPADLITKTEIVGRLPGYIRKYRGVWVWPSEPPSFVVFVERLSRKEMTIALLSRAMAENESYREKLRENSREKLAWNGTAFSSTPEGELQSKTTIYISAFGQAMLVIHENRIEAWPMCFISAKHY
jgi:hypothetical protein